MTLLIRKWLKADSSHISILKRLNISRNISSYLNCFLIILTVLGQSCAKKAKSVSDLYKFPDTKDVQVRVTIDYKQDVGVGPSISFANQEFLLKAYVFDVTEKQVALGVNGSEPITETPVTLLSASTAFDAILRIPADVQPGSDGYSFRFELIEVGTTLLQDVTTDKNLESLKRGVQAGTSPETNIVPLSLATKIAYKWTRSAGISNGNENHKQVYESLLNLIKEKIKLVESELEPSAEPDLKVFAQAISAGLKLKVLNDLDFQKTIFESFANGIEGDEKARIAKFNEVLKDAATQAKSALGTVDSPAYKIFKSGKVSVDSIPDPETISSTIFAPAAIDFTDEDLSALISGVITITPPKVVTGIEKYKIYLGGPNLSTAKTQAIGEVVATQNPLTFTISSGITVPSGVSRFWVFPVVGSEELSVAKSAVIFNKGSLTIAYPNSLVRLRAGSMTSQTPEITDTGENRSVEVTPALPTGITIDSTTGVISGIGKGYLPEEEYLVKVTSTAGTGETNVSLDIYNEPAPSVDRGSIQDVVYLNERAYILGNYTFVGNYTGPLVAMNPETGKQPSTSYLPGLIGEVYAIANDPAVSGGYYVAGSLTSGRGAPAINSSFIDASSGASRIFRINADGTINQNFNAAVGSGKVFALAVIGERLYVGGDFSDVNDQSSTYRRLVSLNASTGAIDTNFVPGVNSSGDVYALESVADRLYVGGSFRLTADTTNYRNLAALNPSTGAIDLSYPYKADSDVYVFKKVNGKLFVGGYFQAIGSTADSRAKLASIDIAGKSITSFDGEFNAGAYVYALDADDTNIYVGGNFASSTVKGVTRNHFAAFNLNSSAIVSNYDANFNDEITGVIAGSSKIIAVGRFTETDSQATYYLAAISKTDGSAAAVNNLGNVGRTAVKLGNTAYIGGEFIIADAIFQPAISAFNPSTLKLITSFNANFAIDTSSVRTAILHEGKLVVGGQFQTVGGQTRSGIAKLNANTGALDTSFTADIATNRAISTIAYEDSKYYLGGTFTTINSQSATRLASINASTGTLISDLNASGEVTQIHIDTENRLLYAAGGFSTIGGTGRNRFAVYDLNASALTSFNISVSGGVVKKAKYEDGHVYLVGQFTDIDSVARNSVAKVNLTNGSVSSLDL